MNGGFKVLELDRGGNAADERAGWAKNREQRRVAVLR
jgi:hypothetical protein